jgi:hypothetical protein
MAEKKIKIEFTKKELQKLHFLLAVAHRELNAKGKKDKVFFGDIVSPIYEWEIFFSNAYKSVK